jgi:hypothetical protein
MGLIGNEKIVQIQCVRTVYLTPLVGSFCAGSMDG